MMSHCVLGALAAVLLCATFVTASSPPVDSKCNCVKMTTREVNNNGLKQLVRDVEIIVPIRSRENITDPHSARRTRFSYQISDYVEACIGNSNTWKQGELCNPAPADDCHSIPVNNRRDSMSDAP